MSLENINQHDNYQVPKICWSAIGGGALIAFGLTLIFNLLFVSIGLGLNDSAMMGKENMSFIVSLFYILGGFMLLFIAGIITGKIYKNTNKNLKLKLNKEEYQSKRACFGAMHGFLAWVIYLIINLTFLSLLSQATPIESPFMYVNNSHASEQVNKDKSFSIGNSCENTNTSLQVTTKEANDVAQSGAMIIFIIFTSGALAFVMGSFRGSKSNLINTTQHNHINI